MRRNSSEAPGIGFSLSRHSPATRQRAAQFKTMLRNCRSAECQILRFALSAEVPRPHFDAAVVGPLSAFGFVGALCFRGTMGSPAVNQLKRILHSSEEDMVVALVWVH